MRKFMSIILALAMILSMSMTAFAAEANTANTYPTVIMDNEDVRIPRLIKQIIQSLRSDMLLMDA